MEVLHTHHSFEGVLVAKKIVNAVRGVLAPINSHVLSFSNLVIPERRIIITDHGRRVSIGIP